MKNYKPEYQSFEWKLKAYQIKKRDNFTCQICGKKRDLHVHHIIYLINLKLWQYPANYLITLCDNCHISEHAALEVIGSKYNELLISGMLAIDIYKKLKSKEPLF